MMIETDILIAGAGPVGLSLAASLTQKGIRVVVVEAEAELSSDARASTIHPPTLEMFAMWGFVDEVLEKGKIIDRLQFWERSTRQMIASFEYSILADDTPYPFRFQCPQSTVIRVILPHVQAARTGQVLFNHRLMGLTDHGDSVTATVSSPDGEKTYRAQYLIGADGSKSSVRSILNLGFSGKTYEDRFLLFATDLQMPKYFPGMGPVAYIFDPQEWVIVMQLPNLARLVFRLRNEENAEEVMQEANVKARIRRFLNADDECQVSGTWVYHVHQRVTETFRVGRVLLAGDAAHINNPTGGMGMNSGVHDVYFLGEALAEVLNGGSDDLLNEYAESRRRVAVEGIQRMTDRTYNSLTISDPAERETRNQELRDAANDPVKAREFLLRQAMLEDWIHQRPAPRDKETRG